MNKKLILKRIAQGLVVILLITIIGFFALLWLISTPQKTITNIHKYDKALSLIKEQKEISHFPTAIPKEAKKVQLYCYTSTFHGEVLVLKFKTNKEYIEQEFKKHKFINPTTPVGTPQKIYWIPWNKKRITTDDLTFYVLLNENNKYEYDNYYFPYYKGIAIDKNYEYILYYSITPGD